MDSLPVLYYANKNESMTSEIFKKYLVSWDVELERKSRKIVLVLDSCGSTTLKMTTCQQTLIMEKCRLTVQEIADEVGISRGSASMILSEDLGMQRMAAKFVPNLLLLEQQQLLREVVQDMLDCVSRDPEFLKSVITGDESWACGYDPETEVQSSQWKRNENATNTCDTTLLSSSDRRIQLRGSKKSHTCMKGPSTSMLCFPILSPLLTAGKNIVGYFLDRLI
jgi:hypothetical protein